MSFFYSPLLGRVIDGSTVRVHELVPPVLVQVRELLRGGWNVVRHDWQGGQGGVCEVALCGPWGVELRKADSRDGVRIGDILRGRVRRSKKSCEKLWRRGSGRLRYFILRYVAQACALRYVQGDEVMLSSDINARIFTTNFPCLMTCEGVSRCPAFRRAIQIMDGRAKELRGEVAQTSTKSRVIT